MSKKPATLRVCMSCEWVFRLPSRNGCPKCQWASYGARYVFGNKAYRYERTQEPWKKRKLGDLATKLNREIRDADVQRAKKQASTPSGQSESDPAA